MRRGEPFVDTPSETLSKWIGAIVTKGAVRLELRHSATQGRVREWTVSAHTSGDELALEVQSAVDNDGRYAARGRGVYALLAYRAAPAPYFERFFVEAEDGFDEEPERGTNEAVVIQSMRHAEASARLSLGHTNEIVSHYQALLHASQQRVRELEGRETEVARVWESLATQLNERELALIKARGDEKRSDFLREKLDLLMPVAMNKLFGGKGAPPVMGDELIRQLLRSLRPEQMNSILSLLAPEQMALLAEVYEAYGKRELERDKARQEADGQGASEGDGGSKDGDGGSKAA